MAIKRSALSNTNSIKAIYRRLPRIVSSARFCPVFDGLGESFRDSCVGGKRIRVRPRKAVGVKMTSARRTIIIAFIDEPQTRPSGNTSATPPRFHCCSASNPSQLVLRHRNVIAMGATNDHRWESGFGRFHKNRSKSET